MADQAAGAWHTISVPAYFAIANATVRVTVIHVGTTVKIYRDNQLLLTTTNFAALDYIG